MDTSAMDTSVFDDTTHVIQFLVEPANKNKTLWDCLIDGTALSEMIGISSYLVQYMQKNFAHFLMAQMT
jgi:hypothetical protein